MPKSNRTINVRGTYVEGNINIQQGDFVGGGKTEIEIKIENWFQPIYHAISNRPKTTKKKRVALQNNVKEIEQEIQKKEKTDQSFIVERLNNLKKMAPDIWEVALATINNPLGGISLALTKVAKKAAQEVALSK
jgi:hypothetical protein